VHEGMLNMTYLALHLTRFVNGVAMRHRDVSRGMFPGYPINSITNGVHAATWAGPEFAALFDRRIPEWRRDNLYLRYAVGIPLQEIREAHAASKRILLDEIARRTGQQLDPNVMTIGFARRATPYKRADLIFSDLDRLTQIARTVGKIQIVYGGKAHPHDGGGKDLIRRIYSARERLGDMVKVVYIENYEMSVAAKMVAGVDLWLNNPMKPLEASGTSGMKAAANGVVNLSVLDGWWDEGWNGENGWAIGGRDTNPDEAAQDWADAQDLYRILEDEVVPRYYDLDKNGIPVAWVELMRRSMASTLWRFSTTRMLHDYIERMYLPPTTTATAQPERRSRPRRVAAGSSRSGRETGG